MPTLTALANLVSFGAVDRRRAATRAAAARLHAAAAAQADVELELFRTPARVRFAVALTAPFRERFALELHAAARDGREASALQTLTLPGRADWWRWPLARDLAITDAASAEIVVTDLLAQACTAAAGRGGSPAPVADADRATYLSALALHAAAASAGVGYLARDEALALMAEPCLALTSLHRSWPSFGHALARGQRAFAEAELDSLVTGQIVRRLLADPRSPWVRVPWPSPTEPAGRTPDGVRRPALVA